MPNHTVQGTITPGFAVLNIVVIFNLFKAQVQNKTFHMVCLFIRLLRCVNGYIC